VVEGSVTISIKDFQVLLDASVRAKDIEDSTLRASKEIQVFLSYIHSQLDLTEHVESFNRQSKKAKIVIEDNKLRINFNA